MSDTNPRSPSIRPRGTPEPSIARASRLPPSRQTAMWSWAAARKPWRWEGQRGVTLRCPGPGASSTCPWMPATGTRHSAQALAAAYPPEAGCPTSPPASPSPMSTTTWRGSCTMPPASPWGPPSGHLWDPRDVGAGPLGWSCGNRSTSILWLSAQHCHLISRPVSRPATPLAPVSQRRAG